MKKVFLSVIVIAFCLPVFTQVRFISRGKIEFERKINIHRLYYGDDDDQDGWNEQFKKMVPQFKIEYFNLLFTESKSVYQPGKESDVPKTGSDFYEAPATANTVFKDISKETVISQKQVFESQYLIIDSFRNMDWKIQAETRTIAGFECRKAVAKICDSVIVVAFYTDEIIPSTGPESFQGLPGMILGLAIPRLYTTWFATKLDLITTSEEEKIVAPAKGKKSNEKEMVSTINQAIKSWGTTYRDRSIWMATL